MADDISLIAKKVESGRGLGLHVYFYHKPDLSLSFTKWSDRYDSHDGKGDQFIYCYEITSKGIHFISFEEKEISLPTWSAPVRYWSSGHQVNCSLLSVPNKGPVGSVSMYLFHQEKIRETLSALPAWAIAVMQN